MKGSNVQAKWLSIGLLLGAASPLWALAVRPPRTEVHLTPGASTQVELTATNDDKVDVQVDVSKKDWFIPEVNKAWTVDRWLEVQGPAQFVLKPEETRRIKLTIRCPKELTGEVVAMTSFLYQTEKPSAVTPMISVSVYLMAAGTEKLSGEVQDITVRDWKGQINVTAKVKSTGNVHLRPSGRLIVLNAQGAELASLPVSEGQPTYPGSDALYFGTVPAEVKVSPGKYTARADLSYGSLKLQGSRDFTVMPDGKVQMDKGAIHS